jgi:hypothetical protein
MVVLYLTPAVSAGLNATACEKQWETDQSDRLRCELRYESDAREAQELSQDTSGVIKSIQCVTDLNVSKQAVFEAIIGRSRVRLDSHDVRCSLRTNGDAVDLTLTVAPSFSISNDVVSHAAINLSTIVGLPTFMARMLREHVNESGEVSDSLQSSLQSFLDGL